MKTTEQKKEKSLFLLRAEIEKLRTSLEKESYIEEKVAILDREPIVKAALKRFADLALYLSRLSLFRQYVGKIALAVGQEQLFDVANSDIPNCWETLIDDLIAVEDLYKPIGGIIGYQLRAFELLLQKNTADDQLAFSFHMPPKIEIATETRQVRKSVIDGIKAQGKLAELYPVGGAADRLQLVDEVTQEKLPAARLVFLGNHLLEGVIRDLQAREYLAFRLLNKQVVTPIAMMTSEVNGNAEHIEAICAENHWFGRPKESFRFFNQPLVPTFTEQGTWCLESFGKLLLRPSGHGVIWTLAEREGIFDWFRKLGKEKILIRQINNPMAAIDYGLIAFLGIGWKQNKLFGFASCPRMSNTQEGVNVVKVIQTIHGEKAVLTNIEYCDFERFGLEKKGSKTSYSGFLFPSNTNILFADLAAATEAAKKLPFPGLLVNFRDMNYFDGKKIKKDRVARLEATMQNIADFFAIEKKKDESPVKGLTSYLTLNERRKTISTAKRKTNPNGSLIETPDGCYYDFLKNAHELLEHHCGIELPPLVNEETFKTCGPTFLFSYHPALGPLYSIIGQKVRKGRFSMGSELHLEIADVDIFDLTLQGSLLVGATSVVGHIDECKQLCYSYRTGQCILHRVRVENKGIDWSGDHLFWKHDVKRSECLEIRLIGHSQFIAKDITLSGNLTIEVPDGVRMIARQKGRDVVFEEEAIKESAPFWHYKVGSEDHIVLSRTETFH